MKFKSTPYHLDLLKDKDRLSIFYEAISTLDCNLTNTAYDLGCGSGILSYFAQPFFDEIIAIEIDSKIANYAKSNLMQFSNIKVVNSNVFDYDFEKKADLIICEMLDTALIDEEQVPIINYARNFLKEEGKIIPQGVINYAQLVNMEREYIHYDDGDSYAKYKILSNKVKYSSFNFYQQINPYFESEICFKINENIDLGTTVNGLILTTITKLTDNIVSGFTHMLNPPLLIPIDEKRIIGNDLIKIKLSYSMGKGIESIRTSVL